MVIHIWVPFICFLCCVLGIYDTVFQEFLGLTHQKWFCQMSIRFTSRSVGESLTVGCHWSFEKWLLCLSLLIRHKTISSSLSLSSLESWISFLQMSNNRNLCCVFNLIWPQRHLLIDHLEITVSLSEWFFVSITFLIAWYAS